MDNDPLFSSGQVIITYKAYITGTLCLMDCLPFLERHLIGDWGDINDLAKAQNDKALSRGQGVLSLYKLPINYLNGKPVHFKIVTTPQRHITAVMVDSEDVSHLIADTTPKPNQGIPPCPQRPLAQPTPK